MLLRSETLKSSGSCKIRNVTPSVQGGMVRDPEYCRIFMNPMPPAVDSLASGFAILATQEERERIM